MAREVIYDLISSLDEREWGSLKGDGAGWRSGGVGKKEEYQGRLYLTFHFPFILLSFSFHSPFIFLSFSFHFPVILHFRPLKT